MASETQKTKADPTPQAVPTDKSPAAEPAAKPAGGETASSAPANYSRGEGQKPVTAAYKENWNAIFAKKTKTRTKKTKR